MKTIDDLINEFESEFVKTPAGNISVIDEMIPCDVMNRLKSFLYQAYELGKNNQYYSERIINYEGQYNKSD